MEVRQPSKLWVLFTKSRPSHQQVLVSSPKKGSSSGQWLIKLSLHRNVTACKNKRKKKSYVEIVKEKISERKTVARSEHIRKC